MKIKFSTYLILFFSTFVFYAGCRSSYPVTSINPDNYLGYKPIDPLPVQMVTYYDENSDSEKEAFWKSIKDVDEIRALLPLQSAQVAISKTEVSGNISYVGASLSGERGSYHVIMDYMKYRVEDVYDENGQYIGSGRIGVGLRIKAMVVTAKANLNLGSIGALGLEASAGNLSGGISVDIIGIDSENVTNLIPLTSEIDQTSIQSALQALASIKSKLWEEETTITPHLVAIQQAVPDSESKIRIDLSSATYMKSSSGDLLREFWKPDGTNINEDNESKLIEWMENHNMDTGAGTITMFLRGAEYESLRKKAVKDLINENQ